MHITYIHQYFNTPDMSGGTRSYEMAKRLVAKKHQVNMVTSWREDDGRKDWFETEDAGIHVHWLPIRYSNKMNYNERMGAFLRFAWEASFKAASLAADVIFATSTPLTIALPGVYAARRQKVPMVFEVRDLWPELPIAVGALQNPILRVISRKLEQIAYMKSKCIVALSPGMKDGIMRAGFPEDKITVIPNSADIEFFDTKKINTKAFRADHPEIGAAPLIIYAGSLGKINNVAYLVHIAAASRKKGFPLQFAVVGRGMEEEKIRKEATKLGVLGINFHMYPAVPKIKMPEIMSAADIAVSLFMDLKPMWANSANKFFDALASGTPVAINYGGWQADLIKETGAGIIISPNEPEAAAVLLCNFVEDKKRLAKAAHAARKMAEERFSRDKLADQLEKVLLSAAGKAQASL